MSKGCYCLVNLESSLGPLRASMAALSHGLGCDVEPHRTLTRVNTEVKQQEDPPPTDLHTYCHTPLKAAYLIPHCCSFIAPLLHRLTKSKQTRARARTRARSPGMKS